MTTGSDRQRRLLERLTARLEADAREEDFSMRVAYPYLLGVYLGVNALRDAFLVVEGPDCSYMKTQYIQGNHDWLSTLSSVMRMTAPASMKGRHASTIPKSSYS